MAINHVENINSKIYKIDIEDVRRIEKYGTDKRDQFWGK